MSQATAPLPDDTGCRGAMLLDADSPYRFVGDALYDQFHDEDFADCYPHDGQPALAPVLLSFVLIFKALDYCAHRKAAWDEVLGRPRCATRGHAGYAQAQTLGPLRLLP